MAIAGGATSGVWIQHVNGQLRITWHTGLSKLAQEVPEAVENVSKGDKVFILAQDWAAFEKAWKNREDL